jgi:hypothetical protein
VGPKGLVLPKEPKIVNVEPTMSAPQAAPQTRGQVYGGLPFYQKKAADSMFKNIVDDIDD